jgi:phosphohistidine phosphatase SixA
MKKLIVIRHCAYDLGRVSRPISPEGRAQAERLRVSLSRHMVPDEMAFLSSKETRAWQTAEMIAGRDIEVQLSDVLFSDDKHPFDEGDVFHFVNSFFGEGVRTVVVVTHLELAEALPAFIMEELQFDYVPRQFGRGEGVVLDLSTGKYEFLP